MTQEQEKVLMDAVNAEQDILLVEMTDAQKDVAEKLDISLKELNKMAESAFASVLRGKLQGSINKLKLIKYDAERKGRTAMASEIEAEIVSAEALKITIS